MQVINLWLNSVNRYFSEPFLMVNKDWIMTLPDTVFITFKKHNLRIYSLEQERAVMLFFPGQYSSFQISYLHIFPPVWNLFYKREYNRNYSSVEFCREPIDKMWLCKFVQYSPKTMTKLWSIFYTNVLLRRP